MEKSHEIKVKEIVILLKGLTLKEAKEIIRQVEEETYRSAIIS